MDARVTNEASEAGGHDVRQLLAEKKKSSESGVSWIRGMLASRLSGAIDLLESSAGSLSAVCLCLVLAGVSLFLIQRYYAHTDVLTDVDAGNGWESLQAEPTSGAAVAEDTGVGDLTDGSFQYGPSGATEEFMIRVGAFREASNAKRVAASLQEKNLNVRTVLRPDGIHVVTLGPFSRKGAAEAAARSVQESLGLVPQVLRSYLR